MTQRVKINADILTWAITRAGYELHDFLLKFPKVQDWLDDKKNPSIKQLQSFANSVYVPFGYLFLQEPPEENIPIPYFRTGKGETKHVSLNTYDTILMLQKRQDWLVEYLKNNEFDAMGFVGKFTVDSNYDEIVDSIRKKLDLNPDWASEHKTWDKALNHLTEKIEEIGIITTFNGVVGNNVYRPISVEECRGFVLVDKFAPFMFINNSDAKSAQIFTIIHELAHIWIGESAGFDFRQLTPADDPIELLCNKVAAEFLVPTQLFLFLWNENDDFKSLGLKFKVSPIVIARRALELGMIKKEAFFSFYNSYMNEFNLKKNKKGSGGNFYATTKKRLSLRFAYFLNQALKQNQILYRDAYQLSNLKGNTYHRFVKEYLS